MLLGQERSDPAPLVNYEPKTGRFVFFITVFAACAMAEGDREPGPYQTESARIQIEGKGVKPLTVSFYDEVPDVLITLDRPIGLESETTSNWLGSFFHQKDSSYASVYCSMAIGSSNDGCCGVLCGFVG